MIGCNCLARGEFIDYYNLHCCSDGGRSGSANAFVGGFVLGGLIVGALGCAYAPQVPFFIFTGPFLNDLFSYRTGSMVKLNLTNLEGQISMTVLHDQCLSLFVHQ